jgi:hypothetical protein
MPGLALFCIVAVLRGEGQAPKTDYAAYFIINLNQL